MNNVTELKYQSLSTKLDTIKEKTFSLLNQFDKSETINILKKNLDANRERTELKVAFVGQYNAGKSTIISALTNRTDIKIDSNVATDKSSEYEWNNIRIVDTPGILAGKVEQHDITTKETLSNTDLIVYVLTSQLFDDVIFENFIDLAYKQNLKDKMLIAINKMSMEKGDFDTLQKNYTESIKTTFKEKGYDFNFEIVFIDAFDYIEGVSDEEEDLIEMSNFSKFIETLNIFIQNKGIIQKSFDTPIRIIKDEIDKIALDETDPSFSLVIKKYENRILKHKKNLIDEVQFLYDNLRDKILTEGYSISSFMGETSQEEFDTKQNKFNKLIEKESINTMNEIEILITEKNKTLGNELSEVADDKEVVIYTQNLQHQFNKKEYKENFKSSSFENKFNFLDSIKNQATTLSKFTGASNTSNIFAKSAEIAGSKGHSTIYQAGKAIGYKFKPWEAVKITKNIGNVAKFAGPAISVVTAGISIYGAYKEEKALKQVVASKNQMNDSFNKIANDVIKELDVKFKDYIKNNVDNKLQEFASKKMEIIKQNETNSSFLNEISELKSEYVDFIEIVNE